jgi:hypothetical protein
MLSYARHISCVDYRLLHSLGAMIRTMSYSNLQIAACGGPPDLGPQPDHDPRWPRTTIFASAADWSEAHVRPLHEGSLHEGF